MDCKDCSQFLDLYLLNKIEPQKKKLFEEHLKKCPRCQKELEIEYKIKEAFKNIAQYEVPTSFKQKVLSQIPINLPHPIQKQKFSIIKELSSLLERNTLFWIIYGFLLPFIIVPISLSIFGLFTRIGKAISEIEKTTSILTVEQILIINLIITISAFLYGLWRTLKFLRE